MKKILKKQIDKQHFANIMLLGNVSKKYIYR